MELLPHQKRIVERNPKRHLLAHGTGTGKTITAISLGNNNCRTCLVICPKILKEMWKRETELYNDGCRYSIYSKEEFKKLVATLPEFDGVIVDEGHFFAGEKSQLSKALQWYFKKWNTIYRWICTATPYLSTPMNIYMLAKHLGYNIEYWQFRRKYFSEVKMGNKVIPVPKKGCEKDLAKLVQDIGSTVDMEEVVAEMEEVVEIPKQTFETEYFDKTIEQKVAITLLDEPQFITKWTKTHTIENGLLYGDGYVSDVIFPCLKHNRIIELCKENKKVAIFCRYNKQIQVIVDILRDAGISQVVYTLTGETKERDAVIREADAQDSAIIIIQASCSAGYELPSFPLIIFASLSFSYVDYAQGIGRFLRVNRLKENKYIHLVTHGVDEDIYKCIMNKQDFSFEIYGKI